MLRICVYMHSRFIENHSIWILKDGPLISEGVCHSEGLAGGESGWEDWALEGGGAAAAGLSIKLWSV
jgi:hypothetical protein